MRKQGYLGKCGCTLSTVGLSDFCDFCDFFFSCNDFLNVCCPFLRPLWFTELLACLIVGSGYRLWQCCLLRNYKQFSINLTPINNGNNGNWSELSLKRLFGSDNTQLRWLNMGSDNTEIRCRTWIPEIQENTNSDVTVQLIR